MIILHFDLQPQSKYMNYFIYNSHQDTAIQKVKNLLTNVWIAANVGVFEWLYSCSILAQIIRNLRIL